MMTLMPFSLALSAVLALQFVHLALCLWRRGLLELASWSFAGGLFAVQLLVYARQASAAPHAALHSLGAFLAEHGGLALFISCGSSAVAIFGGGVMLFSLAAMLTNAQRASVPLRAVAERLLPTLCGVGLSCSLYALFDQGLVAL